MPIQERKGGGDVQKSESERDTERDRDRESKIEKESEGVLTKGEFIYVCV